MFCTKCGRKLEEGAVFCSQCAHKVSPEAAQVVYTPSASPAVQVEANYFSEHPKTSKKQRSPAKRFFTFVITFVILCGLGFGGYCLYNNPVVRMVVSLHAGNVEYAYTVYEEDYHTSTLPDYIIELLRQRLHKAQEQYTNGSITIEDLDHVLDVLERFELEALSEDINEVKNKQETNRKLEAALREAQENYDSGDYYFAWDRFNAALKLDETNITAAEGAEKAKKAYRQERIEAIGALIAEKNYDNAVAALKNAEKYFKDDADFETLREQLEDLEEELQQQEIELIQQDILTTAKGGDWEGALELIDSYQVEYPDMEELEETRKEVIRQMPISLENLTVINSNHIETIENAVTDRWGGVYDGAIQFDCSYDAFGLYNLNAGYSKFSATVFTPKETSSNSNLSFAIYLDEVLIHHVDNITVESEPVVVDIDVSGAITMRIIASRNTGYYPPYLYFTESNFEKIETGAEG